MDKDKKYVRVPGKLFVEQADKVDGGVAIVQGQRAAQSNYPGSFSGFHRDLSGHSTLQGGNVPLAMPLFCQAERFVRGYPGLTAGCSSDFRLLSQDD
jgi:hypothetical protein